MTSLFKKLNFKAQEHILVLNAPEEFEAAAVAMAPFTTIHMSLEPSAINSFVLVFVQDQKAVKVAIESISPSLAEDAVLWFAYPKGSSKKYKAAINRDNGWEILGEYGFEGVRQVAIDEDWSALRFRKANYIKKMVRSDKNRLIK